MDTELRLKHEEVYHIQREKDQILCDFKNCANNEAGLR